MSYGMARTARIASSGKNFDEKHDSNENICDYPPSWWRPSAALSSYSQLQLELPITNLYPKKVKQTYRKTSRLAAIGCYSDIILLHLKLHHFLAIYTFCVSVSILH